MADKTSITADAWRSLAKSGAPPSSEIVVHKQFATTIEAQPDRCVKFVITTIAPDREQDIVFSEGIDIENFVKNPVITWAHDYRALPVGRCVSLERHSDRILAVIEFAPEAMNPFAEQVYRMVKGGFVNATSIGFRPLEWTYDEPRGGVNFTKAELLEVAVVPIPAHPQALIAASAAGIDLTVVKDWATKTLSAVESAERQARHAEVVVLAETFPSDALPRADAGGDPTAVIRLTPQAGDAFETFASGQTETRWNRQRSKAFDVTAQEFPARSLEQDLAAKYCGCAIKDLYHREEPVYSTRMGAFLTALNETLADMTVDDVRNISGRGEEEPPLYERIQLNSTRAEEFLIDGMRFCQWHGVKVAIKVEPRWYGLQVTTYAERKHADAGRAVFAKTFGRAKELNFLKGEAFSLSGEFLTRGATSFADLFLSEKNQAMAQRILSLVNEKGADLENRGVIMLGPPGNGKTLLGRILMNHAKATFIWASARDFWYSGGFRGLANMFAIARECAPSIMFIEDVDNYLGGQETDLMKTEMDGLAQSTGVVTILTTNYPELLPKALIDRPGRFHDVLRFDLPDASTRQKMLATWMPDLAGVALTETIKALHGYSGAHVREFARFAEIIRSQDGLAVDAAATAALAKLQEQRDLITAVQISGSRYRAPAHVTQRLQQSAPAPTWALLADAARGDAPTMGFESDVVGWKAFVKARDRAVKKGGGPLDDATIADLLADYGFDREAALITKDVDVIDHTGDAPADAPALAADAAERIAAILALAQAALTPLQALCELAATPAVTLALDTVLTKSGRVLSKANETRLRNAEASTMAAAEQIRDVLATVGDAADDDEDAGLVIQSDVDPHALVLVAADAPAATEIDALPARDAGTIEVDFDDLAVALKQAVRDGMQHLILGELTKALNAARGRVD